MEKQSTFKQYVLPFILVNTLMIFGWIIIVFLFQRNGIVILNCLSRQYGILIMFGISAFVHYVWIYCPHFSDLYRHSERNDNIGLPLASLGMSLCMFMFAKRQYLYTLSLYLASTAFFMFFLYWDVHKFRQRQRKAKSKTEKLRRNNHLPPKE